MSWVDRTGMSDAEVLMRLWNASTAKETTMSSLNSERSMCLDEAQKLLIGRSIRPNLNKFYFDWLHGRAMEIDVSQNPLDTRLYDRDNGVDAAEEALTAPDTTSA